MMTAVFYQKLKDSQAKEPFKLKRLKPNVTPEVHFIRSVNVGKMNG